MEHLKDFVWMSRKGGEPEKVASDPDVISRKMVAGYVQVFPDEKATPKEGKK